MAIDRWSFGTCVTYTLPMMSFHFLKSRGWRRRARSLVCHLRAGKDKNIFLVFAIKSQNYAGVKIIVKAPPVTVLSWGKRNSNIKRMGACRKF